MVEGWLSALAFPSSLLPGVYGSWLYMGHGCIWGMVVYGAWLYMGHGCIWGMVVYGAWLYMGHGCIWVRVEYGTVFGHVARS